MVLSVAELAERINAKLVGSGSARINGIGGILSAGENQVSFISEEKYMSKLKKTNAGAVIVGRCIEDSVKPQLIVKDVNAALIETLEIFAPKLKTPAEGIDPTAKIGQDVIIAAGVSIGPGVVVNDGIEIGENTVIAGGCKIGQNTKIGRNCRIDCNVVVYHNCIIGNNVVIQAGTIIGSSGFGYSFINGEHKLIPHIGRVVIEDFVEIGANSCIDRAKFGETRIGAGTKIDNLVQIAHNVTIGKCCLIAGCAGIAGSCKIGDGVVLGGQVGIVDHIEIGSGVFAGAHSLITHNISEKQRIFGVPAIDKNEALKVIALTRRLPGFVEKLQEHNERIKELASRISGVERLSNNNVKQPKLRLKAAWIAVMAAVVIICLFVSWRIIDEVTNSYEHQIKHIIKEYQDGNDNFYISSSPYLEDLLIDKHLSVIADLPQDIEKIVSNRDKLKDCFFLVSYKDLERIKNTKIWTELSFVTEVYIVGEKFALLSTERG